MTTLRVYRGDTLVRTFTLTDFGGTALNLTAASATFSVKATLAAGTYVFQKTGTQGGATSGITYPAPTSGQLTVEVSPSDTQNQAVASYVWDLQVTLSSGRVYTFPRDTDGDPLVIGTDGGIFVIMEEVTRP